MNKQVIFERKNILVVGGAGFIGSHLCDELIKENKVICLDNFISGDEKNIDHLLADPNFEFIKHDITLPIELEKQPELQKFKIEFQGIQEIFNLACPTSPKKFNENRLASLMANSYGVKNVLDLALKYKAKLLHFSSSVVYGYNRSQEYKIKEDDQGQVDMLSERSAYDEGKRFAETMVLNYRIVHNLDAKIMRLFRIYGPRMKIDEGHMIPDFISQAIDNKDLIIYGDKNFTSSFCFISDCIDAAIKMIDSEISGPLNIGSDILVNLSEMAKKIIGLLGAKSKIIYQKPLLFMSPLGLPDISKARQELNWMPIISLDKGLERTIYELRANKGLKSVSHI